MARSASAPTWRHSLPTRRSPARRPVTCSPPRASATASRRPRTTASSLPRARVPREAPEDPVWRWQALCAGGRAHRLADRVVTAHGTDDRLDAATIGAAAVDAVRAPDRWREWGAPAAVLTHLKDLWLMLVALGAPPL